MTQDLKYSAILTAFVISATPAAASSMVYTDVASFNAAVGSQTAYSFPEFAGAGMGQLIGSSFTKGPVNFSSALPGLAMFDDAYGQPYLGDSRGGPLSISTNLTELGLNLGAFYLGGQTVTYTFGSIIGTLVLPGALETPDTTFLGLRTDGSPISITFSNAGEIDVISFVAGGPAAVPEPGTWIMTIAGFGGMGAALRRNKVATRVRFA